MRIRSGAIPLILLQVATLLLASSNDDADQVEQDILAAKTAMSAGKLVEAQLALQKAFGQEPKNGRVNLELGLLLGQEGKLDAAEKALRTAIEVAPKWPEAHYNLGLILIADAMGKRDWPAAVLEFREAVRLRPEYTEARRWLGTGLSEVGDQDGAVRELRAALAENPNSPEIHLDLGKALDAAQRSREAEREYREAVRLRPNYAEAQTALGKLLLATDGYLEAIEHFSQALRANPDTVAAQYGLSRALRKTGHAAEADVALRQVAALSKKVEQQVRSNRLSNEGLDAAHSGDSKNAIQLLREALDLRPDNALAHYNLGLVLADQEGIAAGIAQVTEAISLAPLEPRFYLSLARMWKKDGDGERARAAFERALNLDPTNLAAGVEIQNLPERSRSLAEDRFLFGSPTNQPEAHFAFASVLGSRGDWMDAVGEWLRVLALQPNNVDARNNLAISYAHLGKDEDAELEFRKALAVASNSPGAHFGLAVLEMQQGKKAYAAQELREVLRLQPDYPHARNLLSLALR